MSVIWGPGVEKSPLMASCGVPERNPVCIQAVPGQTGDILRLLDANGATLSAWDINGAASGGAASPSGSVILAPSTANRNRITPTAGVGNTPSLEVQGVTAQTTLFQVTDPAGFLGFAVNRAGSGSSTVVVGGNDDGSVTFEVDANSSAQTADVVRVLGGNPYQTRFEIDGAGTCFIGGNCAEFHTDTGAPRIGFFGATAVGRRTNGTAAALAAITDANAKAFLTALSNGLVDFGLFAAPA